MKHPGRNIKKMINLAKKDDIGRRLIEVGEIAPLMAKEMEKGLAKCMQDNLHRREPYYIRYSGNWYKNGTKYQDTFTPFGFKPTRLLNTICWLVDNKAGHLEELWVLPIDAPIENFGETGKFDETLVKSSQGIPILY